MDLFGLYPRYKIIKGIQDTSQIIKLDLIVIDRELTHLGLDASVYIYLFVYYYFILQGSTYYSLLLSSLSLLLDNVRDLEDL